MSKIQNALYKAQLLCKLTDGTITAYDCCTNSATKSDWMAHNCEYLGAGVIYAIGGRRQTCTEVEHFWRKVDAP